MDDLVNRLRGRYAMGPHLPNGQPEFGWRQFEAPPIQHEAAAEIERLRKGLERIADNPYTNPDDNAHLAACILDGTESAPPA
jgi:hypothetical protein